MNHFLTYDTGYLHKLITIDTPHFGSFVANLGYPILQASDFHILGFGNARDEICNLSALLKHPLCQGAIEDLTTDRCYDLLGSAQVPSHAIIGNKYIDTACILLDLGLFYPDPQVKALVKLLKLIEFILKNINRNWGCENWANEFDVSTNSDFVVSVPSQMGGLSAPWNVTEFNMWHMACFNDNTDQEVFDLVRTPVDSLFFADGFDAVSYLIPPPSSIMSASAITPSESVKQTASVNASLVFLAPSANTTVAPGDTVTVEVTTTNGAVLDNLKVFDSYNDLVKFTTPPYTTTFTIPDNAYGKYSIVALGETDTGGLLGASLYLDIADDASVDSVAISPESLDLTVGESIGLSVKGHFSDGTDRDLSNAGSGVTYYSDNDRIVTVDENGTCVGMKPGATFVRVSFPGMEPNYVSVRVAEPYIQAAFSATPLCGRPPLSVRLTNLSAGYVKSSVWDFGDGTGSNSTNATHVFQNEGNFTVALTVRNGSYSNSFDQVIRVFAEYVSGDSDCDGDVDGLDLWSFIAKGGLGEEALAIFVQGFGR